MPDQTLGQDTSYPAWGFYNFPQPFQAHTKTVEQSSLLRYDAMLTGTGTIKL
jgi:hypothetical protein